MKNVNGKMKKAGVILQALFTTVGAAAGMAIVLGMLATMLPTVSDGSSSGVEHAPEIVEAAANPIAEPSPSASTKVGLLLNDSRAFQGYTLIAPMFSKTTYLIDMEGKVVRTMGERLYARR